MPTHWCTSCRGTSLIAIIQGKFGSRQIGGWWSTRGLGNISSNINSNSNSNSSSNSSSSSSNSNSNSNSNTLVGVALLNFVLLCVFCVLWDCISAFSEYLFGPSES